MSATKINDRNLSFIIKRDHSARNVHSRDRNARESEDFLSRKRFKIQPYSSFEDRFIEQERINKRTWEMLNKIEEKTKGNMIVAGEIERNNNIYLTLEKRINDLTIELNKKDEIINEMIEFKQIMLEKISNDQQFKGKSIEKTQVLFEEIVRVGQNAENCEKTMQILQRNLKKYKSKAIASEILPELEEKMQVIQSNLSNISQSMNYDKHDFSQMKLFTEKMKNEFESYLGELKSNFQSSLYNISEDMMKRIENEGNNRIKNSNDFKYSLDITSHLINERLSSDIIGIKNELLAIDQRFSAGIMAEKESLNELQRIVDKIAKEFQKELNDEKLLRIQLENSIGHKILDLQNQLNLNVKDLKAEQAVTISKFTETLYVEIDTRMQAENELKCMIEITCKDILTELQNQQLRIDSLKIELTNKEDQLKHSISEKADLVSRYAESESQKLNDLLKNNYNNCKQAVSDLTESLKNNYNNCKQAISDLTESLKKNIINTEKWKNSYIETSSKLNALITKADSSLEETSKKMKTNILKRIKILQTSLEKKISSNCKILEKRTDTLKEEMQKCLDELYNNSIENKGIIKDSIAALDEKICKIDDCYHQEIEDIIENIDSIDKDIKFLVESTDNYSEIIAQLETRIDLKISNEKISREHMVNFFQQEIFIIIEELKEKDEIIDKELSEIKNINKGTLKKISENIENFEELSKGFEHFRTNIKAEIHDYLEDLSWVKEKIENGEILLEEVQRKIEEVQEDHTKFRILAKNVFKNQQAEYLKESQHVVNDLTNRVENMDILTKLNLLFKEMDSNEIETQAMLQLYKKELEYIQERQKKALEEAQATVYTVFEQKISDLQGVLVGEMQNAIKMVNENKFESINLSGLQEISKRFKK